MQEIVKDRLPLFSDEESRMVKCSIDYVGINHYTSYYMKDPGTWNLMPVSYQDDWHAGFVCKFWLHNTKFLNSGTYITFHSFLCCCQLWLDAHSVICFSNVSVDERNGVPIGIHVRVLLDAYKYQRQGKLKVGFASDYVTANSLIVQANSYWLYIVPWGINKAVNYVKETYENPTMILAENGTHE